MANSYEKRSGMKTTYGGGSKTRTYQSGPSYGGTDNTKKDIYTKNGGPDTATRSRPATALPSTAGPAPADRLR